jgi:hypothetical protein
MIDPIGKEFIYVSKYGGRLRLTCSAVTHQETILMDPESEEILKWWANKKKGNKDIGEQPPAPKEKYFATRVNRFYITAEGNSYEEESCYIIHKDE